ncbi:MAG: TM2 domain-containing protein [Oscillospiraceae bacterium]|jgi:TM2 domain-containing membrane protein YozV/ribosomal protein L32|nr:TM2 domain-containing protein [Oscillospiraceae bacterium]
MAFCRNCGQSIDPNAAVCTKCGFAAGRGQNYCPNCGRETIAGAVFCTGCGFGLQSAQGGNVNMPVAQAPKPNVFCKNCGQSMDAYAAVCMSCGFAAGTGQKYCSNCGKETLAGAAICTSCGFSVQGANAPSGQEQKSKMTAGLLGIFLGAFGVHQFYLGNTKMAAIHLGSVVLGIVCFCIPFVNVLAIILVLGNWIWGLIEGIFILTGRTKTDAKGNPLKD